MLPTQLDFAPLLLPILRKLDQVLGSPDGPVPAAHVAAQPAVVTLSEFRQSVWNVQSALAHMGEHLIAAQPGSPADHGEVARRLGLSIDDLIALRHRLDAFGGAHAQAQAQAMADAAHELLITVAQTLSDVAILLTDPQAWAQARGNSTQCELSISLRYPASQEELDAWLPGGLVYNRGQFCQAESLLQLRRTPMQHLADARRRERAQAESIEPAPPGRVDRLLSKIGWLFIFGWLFGKSS